MNLNGIEYQELQGSPKFEYPDQPKSTREYLVDWDQKFDFINALKGSVRAVGSFLERDLPHSDPEQPGIYCTDASCEGVGAASINGFGNTTYPYAKITATYTLLPTDPQQDPKNPAADTSSVTVITERRSYAGSIVSMPTHRLLWLEGPREGHPVGDDAAVGLNVSMTSYVYDIQYWYDAPDSDIFDDLVGTINKGKFKILTRTFRPHTLMFNHADRIRQYDARLQGSAWQVTLSFTYNRYTWDKLLEPEEFQWYKVGPNVETTDKGPYELADFSPIVPADLRNRF